MNDEAKEAARKQWRKVQRLRRDEKISVDEWMQARAEFMAALGKETIMKTNDNRYTVSDIAMSGEHKGKKTGEIWIEDAESPGSTYRIYSLGKKKAAELARAAATMTGDEFDELVKAEIE